MASWTLIAKCFRKLILIAPGRADVAVLHPTFVCIEAGFTWNLFGHASVGALVSSIAEYA